MNTLHDFLLTSKSAFDLGSSQNTRQAAMQHSSLLAVPRGEIVTGAGALRECSELSHDHCKSVRRFRGKVSRSLPTQKFPPYPAF